MNYRQALRALELRQETRIELGLDRFRRHMVRLGSPQKDLRCIHVAGTNGKGSTCAILESVLRKAGHRVGFYSSPHLSDVRERIKVNGREIGRSHFSRLLARTLRADAESRLTYFELLTSVAFQWFAENSVDFAVLETGLGGRLDATNVIEKPLAAVITSIDLDHMQFLGSTVAAIAREKAGIIKPGRPVFCPELNPRARRVIALRARRLKAPLIIAPRSYQTAGIDWRANRQFLKDSSGRRLSLSLLGSRQAVNVSLARAVVDYLRGELQVGETAWKAGLSSVHWPGRFEVIALGDKTAVLDGAHNPEATLHLARTWEDCPWRSRPARWIMGVMKDKDVAGVLKPLSAYWRDVVAVVPRSPRALDAASLARQIRRFSPRARVSVSGAPESAIGDWLKQRGGPKTAVICGSFYLVGQASELLAPR